MILLTKCERRPNIELSIYSLTSPAPAQWDSTASEMFKKPALGQEPLSFSNLFAIKPSLMSAVEVGQQQKSLSPESNSAYQNGHISAFCQATQHLDPLVMDLDSEDASDNEVQIENHVLIRFGVM